MEYYEKNDEILLDCPFCGEHAVKAYRKVESLSPYFILKADVEKNGRI